MKTYRRALAARWLPALALAAFGWLGASQVDAAQSQDRSETCKGCHEAYFNSYADSCPLEEGASAQPG